MILKINVFRLIRVIIGILYFLYGFVVMGIYFDPDILSASAISIFNPLLFSGLLILTGVLVLTNSKYMEGK